MNENKAIKHFNELIKLFDLSYEQSVVLTSKFMDVHSDIIWTLIAQKLHESEE